jgi:hypothetical protein
MARAKVISKINDRDTENHENLKFLCVLGDNDYDYILTCVLGDNDYDYILTYQELSNIIENQCTAKEEQGTQESCTFKSVTGHQGPMIGKNKDYKRSSYNVLVKWEDGSGTYEPLDIIMKDDPITLALYGEYNRLLDTPGWKKLK